MDAGDAFAVGAMVGGAIGLGIAGIVWYHMDVIIRRERDSLGRERRDLRDAENLRRALKGPDQPTFEIPENCTIIPPGPYGPLTPKEVRWRNRNTQ